MNDEERDARIETLTDAIAETNRAVAATNAAVAVTDATVRLLADDIASLSRLMRLHLVQDHDYPDLGEIDD